MTQEVVEKGSASNEGDDRRSEEERRVEKSSGVS